MDGSDMESSHACNICTENLIETNKAIIEPCKHSELCMTCAKKWCDEKNNCPFCRIQITCIHHTNATNDEIKEAISHQTRVRTTNRVQENSTVLQPHIIHMLINHTGWTESANNERLEIIRGLTMMANESQRIRIQHISERSTITPVAQLYLSVLMILIILYFVWII